MALTTNLLSYWKLDESSGNAADSVGSNTLTNNNSTAYATGKINNGADLEASSSNYFSIASSASLRIKGDMSFSFWVKLESLPSSGNSFWIIDKKSETGEDYSVYAVYLKNNAGAYELTYRSTNGSSASLQDDFVSWTPSTATWYHVSVTRTNAGSIIFYVNGSQQGTTQTGYNGTLSDDSDLAFYIGRYKSADGRYFDGIVDEVGVWNRELTGAEVTSLYNGGTGIQYPFGSATNSNFLMFM